METNIKLAAVLVDGTPVQTCNWQQRADFFATNKSIRVTEYEDESGVVVTTPKGEYHIPKHDTLNAFFGMCGKYKVRVVLKKMVGTLTYWT